MSDGFVTKPNYDTMKVGTIIQALFNPDPNKFLALDGGDYNAGDWPELVNDSTGRRIFPGVFTSTARTLALAPANATIASDNTVFLSAGTSVAGLQASADGITWVNTSIGAATVSSIIVAGSRWIIAPSAGGWTSPAVATTGQTAAAVTTVGNWTATTGGTTTTLTQGLAYGSTANAGAGRTVLCKDGSLATASGLFYMNDGATVWNACSGGSTFQRWTICWTGQRFIVFSSTSTTGMIQTSSDGITWADSYVLNQYGSVPAGIVSCASNGNGIVVAITTGNPVSWIYRSIDHGSTWTVVTLDASTSNGSVVQYVNGKFVFMYNTGFQLFSTDGLSWFYENTQYRGGAFTSPLGVAYKAGTYCFINASTSVYTATENMSKFRLSATFRGTDKSINHQEYIKARS